MSIKDNIEILKRELPSTVKLVAVSKFISNEEIMEAYNAGQRDFAESRPQELAKKSEELPSDISWHFIGHLQTNKIKLIIDKVSLFHSIDSFRLLSELNAAAQKKGITANILLQEHISNEDSKQGFLLNEISQAAELSVALSNLKVCGLMGMASFVEDTDTIRKEFICLRESCKTIRENIFSNNSAFTEISMGMSSDYRVAVEEGSTIIRVGTKIFGNR